MANYSNLKAAIEAAIKTNGNQEITGQVLQDVLTSVVSVLGANYTFTGVATPATNPGTPDQNVFYFATEAGTYSNFGGIRITGRSLFVFLWNGTWTNIEILSYDDYFQDIDALVTQFEQQLRQMLEDYQPIVIEGDVTNAPDEEDLTSVDNLLRFKNRNTLYGMGCIYLRRELGFAEQLRQENTIYVIRYDYTLTADVTIPANCVLQFDGGSLSNGSLVLQNTLFDGVVKFGADVEFGGTCANQTAYQSWFENNDIDAWHRFINTVDGICTYEYTKGDYTPTERITKEVDKHIIICGNGAKLSYSYIQGAPVRMIWIKPKNPTLNWQNIIENVEKFSKSVKVEDASVFTAKDTVILRDTTEYSYSPYRANYKHGEIAVIENVDTAENTITFAKPLYGQYLHTSDNSCHISKIGFIDVKVKDLKIHLTDSTQYSGYYYGLWIERASAIVENIDVRNFTTCIALHINYNSQILKCTGVAALGTVGDRYGLSIGNSQNIQVIGGYYEAKNHGIATGGSDREENIVCRNFLIEGTESSVNSGSRNASLNSHGNGEYFTFRDNTCTGIALGGSHMSAINNRCIGYYDSNISFTETTSLNFTIRDNITSGIGGGIGIGNNGFVNTSNWNPLAAGNSRDNLLIENNTIAYRIVVNIKCSPQDYPASSNVVIKIRNNKTEVPAIKKAHPGIAVFGIPNENNDNNGAIGTGFENSINNGATVIIENNSIAVNQYDYVISGKKVILKNNTITYYGSVKNIYIFGNELTITGNTFITDESISLSSLRYALSTHHCSPKFINISDNVSKLPKHLFYSNTNTFDDAIILIENNIIEGSHLGCISGSGNKKLLIVKNNVVATDLWYCLSIDNVDLVIEGNNVNRTTNEYVPIYDTAPVSFTHHIKDSSDSKNPNGEIYTTLGMMPLQYVPDNKYIDLHYSNISSGYKTFIVEFVSFATTVSVNFTFTLHILYVNGVLQTACVYSDSDLFGQVISWYNDTTNNCIKLFINDNHGNWMPRVKRWNTRAITKVTQGNSADFDINQASVITDIIGEWGLVSVPSLPTYNTFNKGKMVLYEGSLKVPAVWTGNRWIASDGSAAGVAHSGDTNSRPAGSDIYVGFVYMDTTLGKPVYAKAISGDTVTWVDATGATV